MAENCNNPVPEQTGGQFAISQDLYGGGVWQTPYSPSWWVSQTISNIPNDSVGWLVAQGWKITNITYDTTTTPQTPYYTMERESLQNWFILQSLLDQYTTAANTALANNATRYNDVVRDWTMMLETSHDYFETQSEEQSNHAVLYLGNLEDHMNEVDNLIDTNQSQLEIDRSEAKSALTPMGTDYDTHESTATAFLTDLGTTELARINELFAATLATQLQQLVDKGLYSSAIATDITARNTRDKNEEIAALNDRLNREKFENDHRLYDQKFRYRQTYSSSLMEQASRIADHRHRAIVEKMNESVARLSGLQAKHEECMRLMAYQLDERNKLLIGLYGFVERRDDIPPSFEALTQLATSLGDSGGGWVTP